jgi:hypothetical protein
VAGLQVQGGGGGGGGGGLPLRLRGMRCGLLMLLGGHIV